MLPTLSASITPATLIAGGNVGALNRSYDTTTVATLTGAPTVTAIGSDIVGIDGTGGTGVGTFASKNAGTNKAVTVTGYTLSGADAGNYTLVEPAGLHADITPRALGAGSGKTVAVSGISVTGADAGNYAFNSAATTTAAPPRP